MPETQEASVPSTSSTTKFYNLNDEEEIKGKNEIKLDEQVKTKCIKALILSHVKFAKALGVTDIGDIRLMCEVTSIVNTIAHAERQKARDPAAALYTNCLNLKYKVKNLAEKDYASLSVAFHNSLTLASLTMETINSWAGTFYALLSFICAFKHRVNEIRIGRDSYLKKKSTTGGGVKIDHKVKVGHYGLSPAHQPLLEGISYPPMTRSTMAQSIGPLTNAIMIRETRNDVYKKKWKDALSKQISHLPGSSGIVEQIARAPNQDASEIMGMLGSVLLTTGSRQIHRMTPPFPIFIAMCVENAADVIYLRDHQTFSKTIQPLVQGGTVTEEEIPLCPIDFSSKKAFDAWNRAATPTYNTWDFGEASAQIIFHATWGTTYEDLNLLSWMTKSEPWFDRRTLGKIFQKSGMKGIKSVTLPKFSFYAKLGSATPTALLSTGSQQVATDNVFAGHRQVTVSNELLNILKDEGPSRYTVSSVIEVKSALSTMMHVLSDKLSRSRLLQVGTVPWRKMEVSQEHPKGREVSYTGTTQSFFLG